MVLAVPSVVFGNGLGIERDKGTPKLSAGYVTLTEEHSINNSEVRAFIPTESLSPICLVTFAESLSAVPGMTAFCARRIVNGVPGINIHIFYPNDLPDEFFVSLSVYQDGAKYYGEPVPYTGD